MPTRAHIISIFRFSYNSSKSDEGFIVIVLSMKLFNLPSPVMFQARPLLEENAIDELVDPRLGDEFSEHEVYCMLHAASLCLRRDPHSRPRMSQVRF